MDKDDDESDETVGKSRFPCLPSLIALQQMRNRLNLARSGRRLMKWSALATGRELRRIAKELSIIYDSFTEDVRDAFILIARCRYFYPNINKMVVQNYPLKACVTVGKSHKTIAGCKITTYDIEDNCPDSYPCLGIDKGGETIIETKRVWHELLRRLIQIEQLRSNFITLDISHKNATKIKRCGRLQSRTTHKADSKDLQNWSASIATMTIAPKMDPLISTDSESVFEDSSSTLFIDTIDCIEHLLTDLLASDNLIIKKAHEKNEVGNTKTVIHEIYSNDLGPRDDITEIQKNKHYVNSPSNSFEHSGMFDEINPESKNINLNLKQLVNQISDIKKLAEVIKHDGPQSTMNLTIEKFIGDCESIEQTFLYGNQEEKNTSMKEFDDSASEKIGTFLKSCKTFQNNLRQYKAEMNNKMQYCTESMINLIHRIGTVIDLSKNVKVKSDRVAQFIKACEETIKYLQHYENEERKQHKVEEIRYIKRIKNKHESPHTSRQPMSNCSYNSNVRSQASSDNDSGKLCEACCAERPPDSDQEEETCNVLATKVHKITRITRFLNSDGTIQENEEVTTFREDPSEVEDITGFQNYDDDHYEIISERIEEIDDPSTSRTIKPTRHVNLKFGDKKREKSVFHRPNKDNLLYEIKKKNKHKSEHIIQYFTMVQPILRQCMSAEICGFVPYSQKCSIMSSFIKE